jgi:hypothetical protein
VRAPIALVLVVSCVGCLQLGEGDAKVPGDLLGTYHVTGRLRQDGCRAPVLGVTDPWAFEIKLSRFGYDLYWLNGREAIVGDIAADGVSFRFETRVDVDFEKAEAARPGCTIERTDRAAGKLAANGTDVPSFESELQFSYTEGDGSECAAAGVVGPASGFPMLPCTIAYELKAARLEPESPADE